MFLPTYHWSYSRDLMQFISQCQEFLLHIGLFYFIHHTMCDHKKYTALGMQLKYNMKYLISTNKSL